MNVPCINMARLLGWLPLVVASLVTADTVPVSNPDCNPKTQTGPAYFQCMRLPDPVTSYSVTEAILQAPDCDAFTGMDLGVCLFHRFDEQKYNEQAIAALQQSQLLGLSPNHIATAQLLEGLLHCRQARHYRAGMLQPNHEPSVLGTGNPELFCMERRLGLTAITNLDWEQAVINYPNQQHEYTQRLHELEACYAVGQNGPFNPAFADECMEKAAISETEVRALAANQTEQLVNGYFASATHPITAMFSRKIDLTKGVQERSEPKITKLAADVDALKKSYTEQKALLNQNEPRVSIPINRYKSTLLLGYQIMDNYERWVSQFWMHPTEGKLKVSLQEECQALAGKAANLQDAASTPKDSKCVGIQDPEPVITATDISKLEVLVDTIKALKTQEDKRQATIKSMCKLYFCHLLAKPVFSFTKALCGTSEFKQSQNPFCDFQFSGGVYGAIALDDQAASISIVEMCRTAGLPEQFLQVGFTRQQGLACFEQP